MLPIYTNASFTFHKVCKRLLFVWLLVFVFMQGVVAYHDTLHGKTTGVDANQHASLSPFGDASSLFEHEVNDEACQALTAAFAGLVLSVVLGLQTVARLGLLAQSVTFQSLVFLENFKRPFATGPPSLVSSAAA
jgi:hypothetical protein